MSDVLIILVQNQVALYFQDFGLYVRSTIISLPEIRLPVPRIERGVVLRLFDCAPHHVVCEVIATSERIVVVDEATRRVEEYVVRDARTIRDGFEIRRRLLPVKPFVVVCVV